ncbi:MAG: ABC transporter substrate-binding protein [Candidatus Rokubacteria bacterium]|nr:ABC transporter substrate-binding protein [Candidatus Rokubacteria bacterium]
MGKAGVGLLLLVLVCLGAADATRAPVSAQDARAVSGAAGGAVYRRPLGNDPARLDPARVSDIYGRAVAEQIFDGLARFDQTLTIVPALAQIWKGSRDGLHWTFTMRKGVKFHHGREVTADDVVFSLTRILDPALKSGAADLLAMVSGARQFREGKAKHVAGLVALDRSTVRITLDEAHAPLPAILAVAHAKIVPRDVVERDRAGFDAHPIGTGPFRFVRWDRGKEIVLAANPDYFDGAPALSRLVYRIFPGERVDEMYAEFRRGQLEDTPVPMGDYRRIVALPNQLHVKRPMISVRFYGFNTRTKPLSDRRVRQAILYAIDRESLVTEVTLGRFVVARGILPPGTLGFNPRLAGYAYDPRRARQLLAEAGFPGGRGLPPITMWSSAKTEGVVREQEHLRRYLDAVGVKAEFKFLTDWPAFSQRLAEGAFPVFLYAWFADVPDPDNFLSKLFHSRSPRNLFGYANAVVDDLLVRARNEQDLQRRVDLYRRAEQLILDDAPLIPIFHFTYERLFQPYVRSVEVNGLGDPYIPLRKVWLDRR